jgi:hypothetical protein
MNEITPLTLEQMWTSVTLNSGLPTRDEALHGIPLGIKLVWHGTASGVKKLAVRNRDPSRQAGNELAAKHAAAVRRWEGSAVQVRIQRP